MVEEMETEQWLRYLLPLPREIEIQGSVECRFEDVRLSVRPGAGALEGRALSILKDLLGESPSARGAFEIVLGVVGEDGRLGDCAVDGARLRQVPNRAQAYLIEPRGREKLVLAGLDERGVLYAAQTLRQLLEPARTRDRVRIPLLRVADWPDMDERGMWNFPEPEAWVPWMAGMKLNYGKMASAQLAVVERGKPNRVHIDAALMEEARLQGFAYLPYVLHLNFLHDRGLFRAYPELAGKGDGALAGRYIAHKQGNQHRAPCASNPLLVDILAEWLADLAAQGAPEVSCWLSERPAQCECAPCTAVGQFVLEARAFVQAWRRVRDVHPHFCIRLFLSTTTLERDYRVLAELPPEVKVERACATELERVLHLPRDLASNPLYDHCAARGRWIASYDVPIGANGRVDTPEFKVPHSSAHRIRDYVGQLVRRKYSGAYGMMAWAGQGRAICGFNIAALAEWSWNLHGRSEREFATAWAVREGYADPEAVGAWAELMGPVEFDVYDSEFPICYSWGRAIDMVREKRRPYLGEGMFRYYESPESFAEKEATCRRALALAEGFERPDFAHETRVVMSYVELARCIYQVAERVAVEDLQDLQVQAHLQAALAELERAGAANGAAIRAWRRALGPEPWHHRVGDAIGAAERTAGEIVSHVSERYFY